MSELPNSVPYVAKPGDRVRSKDFPGVSGIVLAAEQHPEHGLIYRVRTGFFKADDVTIEPYVRGEP
jgi:hypothetical protein